MNSSNTEQQSAELALWHDYIAQLLGREPRGLAAIAAWNAGKPAVIRVASVVDGKPFPTLFWLIDPDLSLRLDRLEAGGAIARLQARIDASVELQAAMAEDHHRHKALRAQFLTESQRQFLEASGMMSALDGRGIGGIADEYRIRCLHTWYAAHLVTANTIGKLTDELLNVASSVPASKILPD